MTARTRTAVKTVAETVSEAIDANVKYVGKAPTGNLALFAAYALATADPAPKSKTDRDAFALGNRLAGLRARFQNDRRAGKIPATESFADYALRTSGVETTDENRSWILAGIATYSKYVAYRNAKNAGKLDGNGVPIPSK